MSLARTVATTRVFVLLLVAAMLAACQEGAVAATGQPAPPIVGTTVDGQPFDLTDLRGQPVVVNFWYPSCPPCRDEFPLLVEQQAAHAADGLQIVGVLFREDAASAQAFASEMGATWPTVQDPDHAISESYRVIAAPQTYFIDGEGVLQAIHIGQVLEEDFVTQYAKIAP